MDAGDLKAGTVYYVPCTAHLVGIAERWEQRFVFAAFNTDRAEAHRKGLAFARKDDEEFFIVHVQNSAIVDITDSYYRPLNWTELEVFYLVAAMHMPYHGNAMPHIQAPEAESLNMGPGEFSGGRILWRPARVNCSTEPGGTPAVNYSVGKGFSTQERAEVLAGGWVTTGDYLILETQGGNLIEIYSAMRQPLSILWTPTEMSVAAQKMGFVYAPKEN